MNVTQGSEHMSTRPETASSGASVTSATAIVPRETETELEGDEELTWMEELPEQPGVPRGFQQLTPLDTLNVRTTIDSREKCCGAGLDFHVLNEDGELVYTVSEDTTMVCRHLLGPHRALFLSVLNEKGQLVALFVKPWRCDAGWVPCWMHKIMLQTPEDHFVGWVRQRFSFGDAIMDILDEDDEVVFQVKGGPTCAMRCSTSLTYGLYSPEGDGDGGEVVKYDAKAEDLPINMSHEDFMVKFPEFSSEKEKMLMLGAAFLLNFMYFEVT